MSRGRRVKFTDIEVDNPLRFGSVSSSIPSRLVNSERRRDDAKTSEFAFFKKLKEVSGKAFASHSVHNESIDQSDKIMSRNSCDFIKNASSSDKINVVDKRCDFASSFPVESAKSIRLVDSRLSGFGTPKNSDSHSKNACSTLENMQRRLEDVEENSHALRPEGTQQENADIFNKKRQKLCRWVTDTSFPEIYGHGLRGYDIVSKLLSRLIPESKENNNLNDQQFGQVETDAKSILTVYPESDIHRKEPQLMPTSDFTELKFGGLGDDSMHCRLNSSRGRILYLDAPYCRDNDTTNYRYKEWDSDSEIQGGARVFNAEIGSHFSFPFRRFKSTEPIEEIDKFFLPNRYFVSNQSSTPVLSCEYDTKYTEPNLSITFQDIEPTLWPPLASDDKLYGQGLFSSPSVRITEESNSTLPLSRSHLASYHDHEFETPTLEDKGDLIPNSNHNPLALSCQKLHFSPVKERYNGITCHNQGNWRFSNFFNPGNHCRSQTESLLSSGLVFGLDWKSFPIRSIQRDLHPSFYQALEHPRNQSLSHRSNRRNEYENCADDSCHRGSLVRFSEEAEDNGNIHDWYASCFHISLDC